jgi:hypothetical protein
MIDFALNAERTQKYLWTYIDYGFRVPIYRTFQWLNFSISSEISWFNIIAIDKERKNKKRREIRRAFFNDLSVHLSKEYTLVWSIIMKIFSGLDYEEVSKIVKALLGINVAVNELKDLKGIESELKASYVLIDHKKPFLPFSIMQAPITPSYVRPGASSGDLYLFEENLVIDIKSGILNTRRKIPTYCYGGRRCELGNLSKDLKKISDVHNLYGIRKGIGVVADDENHIYLAIYVPWRRWRIEGPLIMFRSSKLPLIIYMNNITCCDEEAGVKPHQIIIKNNFIYLTIYAYDLMNALDKGKINSITLTFPEDPDTILKGEVIRGRDNPREITIEFSTKISEIENLIINHEKSGRKIVLAYLIIGHKDIGEIIYPVIAVTTR